MEKTMAKESEFDQDHDAVISKIHELIALCGGDPQSFDGSLITQQMQNSLKLIREGHDTGQIKLITRSLKEMRYAFRVFNKYASMRTVSFFGSARTPEDHPDYLAAKEFGSKIVSKGWMCMTGAANGIMRAGLEGAQREKSFGLSIRLPYEATTNSLIEGDPKLIVFRYFFTRKLMFVSHSDAIAVFPGGFGTLDELFEVLTLMQTGKADIVPIVLVQGGDSDYWQHWNDYLEKLLLHNRWISPEDRHLYYIADSVDDAIDHILKFYKHYHSSRYVRELFVIRLNKQLTDHQLDTLNAQFPALFAEGKIFKTDPLPEETDHLELPRIAFHHKRSSYSLLRLLIDQINAF